MFEKFTTKDCTDFKQRYAGTYGFFVTKDTKTLVRLEKIRTNQEVNNPVVEFVDRDGLKYVLRADSEDDCIGFEFLPPKSRYHNLSVGAVLVSRIPARQYARGICDRNTSIRTSYGSGLGINFDTLTKLFLEVPVSARSLLLAPPVKDTDNSFAISPQFCISKMFGTIKCLGIEIGKAKVKDDHVFVVLDDYALWSTEIVDALHRCGIKGEVK